MRISNPRSAFAALCVALLVCWALVFTLGIGGDADPQSEQMRQPIDPPTVGRADSPPALRRAVPPQQADPALDEFCTVVLDETPQAVQVAVAAGACRVMGVSLRNGGAVWARVTSAGRFRVTEFKADDEYRFDLHVPTGSTAMLQSEYALTGDRLRGGTVRFRAATAALLVKIFDMTGAPVDAAVSIDVVGAKGSATLRSGLRSAGGVVRLDAARDRTYSVKLDAGSFDGDPYSGASREIAVTATSGEVEFRVRATGSVRVRAQTVGGSRIDGAYAAVRFHSDVVGACLPHPVAPVQDASGDLVLRGLPAGKCAVSCGAPGYATAVWQLDIRPGVEEVIEAGLALSSSVCAVRFEHSGEVIRGAGLRAIAPLIIRSLDPDPWKRHAAPAAERDLDTGITLFRGVGDCEYELLFKLAGATYVYGPLRARADAEPTTVTLPTTAGECAIELAIESDVTPRVRFAGLLREESWPPGLSRLADLAAGGSPVRVDGLPPGKYDLALGTGATDPTAFDLSWRDSRVLIEGAQATVTVAIRRRR